MKRRLAILSMFLSGIAFADAGPEYLEDEPEQDPISSGFLLLELPFEEERVNTLHLRTFYQDRTLRGRQDRENWAGGGWLNVTASYWGAHKTGSAPGCVARIACIAATGISHAGIELDAGQHKLRANINVILLQKRHCGRVGP